MLGAVPLPPRGSKLAWSSKLARVGERVEELSLPVGLNCWLCSFMLTMAALLAEALGGLLLLLLLAA